MSVNDITRNLRPYPMEELTKIRRGLIARNQKVFDFGTGDPKIPTWEPIRKAIAESLPVISQYPSVLGLDELSTAIWGYMDRRFNLKKTDDLKVVPTSGSKEAVFNIALCLVGRAGGKRHIVYPNPGYPVYQSSAIFAGGIPYPVTVREDNGYLLEPWNLPAEVQRQTAALWINYPHNPTGAMAPRDYYERVIEWCQTNDVVLLSDDCYVDIYHPSYDTAAKESARPINPLSLYYKNVISFMSLSKRSGLTGYRSGFMVGDKDLMEPILRARANFGVGSPDVIQKGAIVAWNDESHVIERRRIFAERMDLAGSRFKKFGLIDDVPEATFYLWCRIPSKWGNDDVKFCLDLAKEGVISSPSQWLSEGIKGYVRFALVPEKNDMLGALDIVEKFIS